MDTISAVSGTKQGIPTRAEISKYALSSGSNNKMIEEQRLNNLLLSSLNDNKVINNLLL